MERSEVRSPFARRSFLSRLGGGLVAAGTVLGASASTASAQGTSSGAWRATRDDRGCRPTTKNARDATLNENRIAIGLNSNFGVGNLDNFVKIAQPIVYDCAHDIRRHE